MCKPTVFQKTYKHYLNQIKSVDLNKTSKILGGVFKNNQITIPFFNKPYKISSEGIFNNFGKTADFSEAIVLSKYLLLCPKTSVDNNKLVSYQEFKDSSPLIKYFKNNTEVAIAKHFSNNLETLKSAGKKLEGVFCHNIDAAYHLKLKFNPLPKIPIYLLFNDAEKEEIFPAQSVLLFEKSAEAYLDAECLAILGTLLFNHLAK